MYPDYLVACPENDSPVGYPGYGAAFRRQSGRCGIEHLVVSDDVALHVKDGHSSYGE